MNGNSSNVMNLSASTVQKFQMWNITPQRLFVGASGVENHNEFVDMVYNKLAYMPTVDNNNQPDPREPAEYRGGEVRSGSNGHTMDIA